MKKTVILGKLSILLTLSLAVFGLGLAVAADYPSRNVSVIVPFAAGGGNDMIARALLKNAGKYCPVSFNVVNVPGGGGVVGLAKAITARPDGYTLSIIEANCIQAAHIQGMTKYDGSKDLVPVSRIGFAEASICVKADSKYKTLKDLVEGARANPEAITVAVGSGKGGCWDMPLQTLAAAEKVKFKHVYMHGGAPARTAVLGGHMDACAIGIMEAEPFVRSGDIRILGIFGPERNPKLPEAPTVVEQGYPNIDMGVSFIFYLPQGLDKDQVDYLIGFVEKCFNDPEYAEVLEKRVISRPQKFMGPEATMDWLKNNEVRVKAVLQDLGMAK